MVAIRPFVLTITLLVFTCFSVADADDADLKVMSFNVRHGLAKDGDNHWDKRHELVVQTIQEFNPDLFGLQEPMKFQIDYLNKQLPGYTAFGRTRRATGEDGEHCTIFYRTDRFTKLGGGHFWLSETPDKPGSKSWDSSLPRMVTWLCLRDAKNPETPICFFNTHFDHRGPKARKHSAELIAKKAPVIAKSFENARIILTGDFNTDEGSAPYQELVTKDKETLIDTFRVMHKEESENEGTFNGFKGRDKGKRIDWILVSSAWKIKAAKIVKKNADGRYPSDHFPVTAVLSVAE